MSIGKISKSAAGRELHVIVMSVPDDTIWAPVKFDHIRIGTIM